MTSQKIRVSLTDVIAPAFYQLHWRVVDGVYTHYWLKGGRGSTKSTFAAVEVILGIMDDPEANGVALRKVKDTLHESVFEQLVWAINALGVSQYWDIPKSQLVLTYRPTGQKILFRGADKPKKIKSIVFAKGYCKYIWYEELDEFFGMDEIRLINQSLMRGGMQFVVFYSYNPPKSVNSWVNVQAQTTRADRVTHHSDYLSVPRQWLGAQFLIEAEHLKVTDEDAYNHEYLGEVTGTGGEVFRNVTLREISDEEIEQFTVKRRGLDEGYAIDPLAYVGVAYERKFKRLYIYDELCAVGMSNRKAYDGIRAKDKNNDPVYCDSAAARFIGEMRQYGLRVVAVKKGADSVEYGIKFLQDLEEIVIDDIRCPNAAREFLNYELEKDANGNFKAKFPDKDNHTIDGVRYAMNAECLKHRDEAKRKPAPVYNFPSEKPKASALGGTVTEGFFKGGF